MGEAKRCAFHGFHGKSVSKLSPRPVVRQLSRIQSQSMKIAMSHFLTQPIMVEVVTVSQERVRNLLRLYFQRFTTSHGSLHRTQHQIVTAIVSYQCRSMSVTIDQMEKKEDAVLGKVHVLYTEMTSSGWHLVDCELQDMEAKDHKVMLHQSLESVLRSCQSGDKVLILPGTYLCATLPCIQSDIEIVGLGNEPGEVILLGGSKYGDFINIRAERVIMKNVTITSGFKAKADVVVHFGILDLECCLVEGSVEYHAPACSDNPHKRIRLDD